MRCGNVVIHTALLAVMVAGLSACPQRTAVWVLEGSTSSHLEFVVGRRTGHEETVRFYSLRVERCGENSSGKLSMWMIGEPSSGRPDYPSRVQYGVTPAGFAEQVPAHSLTEGCYTVRLGGAGVAQFEITKEGAVLGADDRSTGSS